MTIQSKTVDAVIIGGGFYGSVIAIYLVKTRGLRRVVLLEREPKLLTRASYNNQARLHNGYHYPRSFTTAFRSRVNFPRFMLDWPQAVSQNFIALYAVAKRNSKLNANQFERFCDEIGANIKRAESGLKRLFEPSLIEGVFIVEESVFSSIQLATLLTNELEAIGVEVHLSTSATAVSRSPTDSNLIVAIRSELADVTLINCRYIFNCTYSGLNQLGGDFTGTLATLKHEVTEMALMEVPSVLRNLGVTIMDGPFFSVMPFPDRILHTMSHVRYTPHFSWKDERRVNPYKKLEEYHKTTRVDRMIRDVGRYMPSIHNAKYIESIFEVKTVLINNEGDDGRPILFERHADLPGCYSVLGGKIDNIYDILEMLDTQDICSGVETQI